MLGDETLRTIARELVATILDRTGECPSTDACACKEDIATDKHEKTTQTVLMRAEVLSRNGQLWLES